MAEDQVCQEDVIMSLVELDGSDGEGPPPCVTEFGKLGWECMPNRENVFIIP